MIVRMYFRNYPVSQNDTILLGKSKQFDRIFFVTKGEIVLLSKDKKKPAVFYGEESVVGDFNIILNMQQKFRYVAYFPPAARTDKTIYVSEEIN